MRGIDIASSLSYPQQSGRTQDRRSNVKQDSAIRDRWMTRALVFASGEDGDEKITFAKIKSEPAGELGLGHAQDTWCDASIPGHLLCSK